MSKQKPAEQAKLDRLEELLRNQSYHRGKLEEAERELAELGVSVEQVINTVADRVLVDDQGQPVTGGVYWYDHRAIVRVAGKVCLIPIQTIDSQTLFGEVARRGQPAVVEEEPQLEEVVA